MPVHEAEAIVLRQYPLFEADRIIVLLTRDLGTLRAVARGVRKPRSRMAACLEPLNHINLQFYAREGAELSRIWNCEMVHSFLGKRPTLDRICGFSYFAELVQELAPENNPNPLLFRLLLAVLQAGEINGVQEGLVRYFEVWALKLNGWLPNYDYCSGCGRYVKDDRFYAWPEAGQCRCAECAQNLGIRIGPDGGQLLHEMLERAPVVFASRPLHGAAARDLKRLTQRLIELHLEKRLKSYQILHDVLYGSPSSAPNRRRDPLDPDESL